MEDSATATQDLKSTMTEQESDALLLAEKKDAMDDSWLEKAEPAVSGPTEPCELGTSD